MASAQRLFFSAPQFAVVGASTNKDKFGTKVLRWYIDRSKGVTPVHPKEVELEGLATVSALSALADPTHTAVSVITPPAVTLGILKQAKELGVPALWLQPGAEDAVVRSYIEEEGLTDCVVLGGPCVLVWAMGCCPTSRARENTAQCSLQKKIQVALAVHVEGRVNVYKLVVTTGDGE